MPDNPRFVFLKPILIIVTLICLTLPAVHPFLQGEIPRTDDGNLHLYRVVVLDHSLQYDGAIYPRYSSGLVYGYGAALFNYFPPTAYYPTVFLHWLGLSFVDAWLWTMIVAIWVAGGGAFLIGREWGGDIGGFITAAAYVYSPYLLFDTVTRGTITEVIALAILPFVLWAFTRLAWSGRRSDFALSVIFFALFIPLHNIVTLHGTLFLMGYCAFLFLSSDQKMRVFAQLLLAGLVAVAMTTFFWLPALGETDATKIQGVADNLNFIDVTRTLRPLTEILALPKTADPSQLQAPIPIALGWPQLLLAVSGVLLSWKTRKLFALQVFLLVVVSLAVFLQMPVSNIIWETLPLLGYSQFAWRILGVASLALALMAGIGGALLLDRMAAQSLKMMGICVLVAILVLYAVPWLYTPYTPINADSVVDAQHYERQTQSLSLSSYSEYLPVNADATTLSPDALMERFAEGDIISRLTVPDGVMLLDAEWQGTSAVIQVQADSPVTLVFDWLYVPGWEARFLDDDTALAPLSVRASQPQGLVSVDIPAGTHRLEVALHRTRLQSIAEGISLGSLLIFVIVTWAIGLVWRRDSLSPSPQPLSHQGRGTLTSDVANDGSMHHAPVQIIYALLVTGVALFLVKALVIDRINSPFKAARFVDGQIANVENAVRVDFSGGIRLLGYEVVNPVQSGNTVRIRAFWTVVGEGLDTDYSTIIHLRDSQQNIIAEDGSFYPGNLATSNWLDGYYLEEAVDFKIPPYTPPGNYTLDIGLFNPETQEHLDVLNADGNPIAVDVDLGTIEITRPDTQPQDLPDAIADVDNLNLLAVDGIPEMAQVGDEMTVRWLWQLSENTNTDVQAKLVWLDDRNIERSYIPLVSLVDNFPTSAWQTGDIWRGTHRLYVPGILFAGEYQVVLQIDDVQIDLGEMIVTRPPLQENLSPDVEHHSSELWENQIALLGYDYTVTTVTLYWETSTQINQSYRLFVQVVDNDDAIVALTDGIPVDWTRPTTSWGIGEVITTVHDFGDLPAGEYRIRVGWYDPLTGDRVLLPDDSDSIFLPELLMKD